MGTNIRKARLQAGLTQEALAEILGIHWKTLGYIEAGKRDFGASILIMLVLSLKLSSAALTEGLPQMNSSQLNLILKAKARKRNASS